MLPRGNAEMASHETLASLLEEHGFDSKQHELIRQQLLAEFNGVTRPRVGFFMENLAASRPAPGLDPVTGTPNPNWAVDLALSQTNMWIGFQALGSWSRPFNPDHVDNTTHGTPAVERWSRILLPPSPQIVTRMLAPDRSSFQLGWTSVTNVFYQVQFSPDLMVWSSAGPALKATNAITVWSDSGTQTGSPPAASPRRFYRLSVTD